jgi:hypothetical protein
MDLVKVTDGKPQRYSYEQFKRDNPRTSFPERASAGVLEPYGFYPLQSNKPTYNPATQTLSQTGVALEGSKWVEQWAVVDLPIETIRAQMSCSKMQGILTLGETKWGEVLTYREGVDTTWAEKVIIDSAQDWQRTSENIAFFGYLLEYTDVQMDDLFIAAALVEA